MDTTNREIISQLKQACSDIFNRCKITEEGTYTAAELAKNELPGDKYKKIWHWPKEWGDKLEENEIVEVTAGNFHMEIVGAHAFSYLWQFEQLERIPQKEKARFTFTKSQNVLAEFTVGIPKEARELANSCSKDSCHPIMHNILLDAKHGYLVASDTHILNALPVTVTDTAGDIPDDLNAFISPKDIRTVSGRCRVRVMDSEDDKARITELTDESGEVYTCKVRGHYPGWRRGMPNTVSREGYVKFDAKGVKSFRAFVKPLAKSRNPVCELEITKGSDIARLFLRNEFNSQLIDKQTSLKLDSPAKLDIAIGIRADNLSANLAKWNGGMWLESPERPCILDLAGNGTLLAMPGWIENAYCRITSNEHIPWETRNGEPKPAPEPIPEPSPAPVPEPTTAPKQRAKSFADIFAQIGRIRSIVVNCATDRANALYEAAMRSYGRYLENIKKHFGQMDTNNINEKVTSKIYAI